jgi:RNA polymerase sigma-70 factor, ECF subfamily
VRSNAPVLPPNTIAQLRRGDDRAFEAVFRAYYAPLASFAFRYLRDAAAAEDAVQDVFGALWASRRTLEIKTSLRAYLYAAVRNRALNIRKHDAVVEDWELDESSDEVRELHPNPPQPDQVLDQKLLDAQLAEAFESLPDRQAQVMRLRWKDEMSYAEIAEAVGISVKGVEKHLSRGLAALKSHLS